MRRRAGQPASHTRPGPFTGGVCLGKSPDSSETRLHVCAPIETPNCRSAVRPQHAVDSSWFDRARRALSNQVSAKINRYSSEKCWSSANKLEALEEIMEWHNSLQVDDLNAEGCCCSTVFVCGLSTLYKVTYHHCCPRAGGGRFWGGEDF